MRASWRPPSYLPLASPLSRAAALKPRGSRITSLCSSPSHIQFIPAIRSHLQQQQRLSSSSTRWKQRQGSDAFARSARVQGLKSRAAFKLLELDTRHRIFQPGQTVVDLGYAPGSWSQVALERTRARPGSGGSKRGRDGLVVGIDIIPAQPPRGVSTIQGNFLSPGVRDMVKRFVMEAHRRRQGEGILRVETEMAKEEEDGGTAETDAFPAGGGERYEDVEADGVVADRASHTDLERQVTSEFQGDDSVNGEAWEEDVGSGLATRNTDNERLVDVSLPCSLSPPLPCSPMSALSKLGVAVSVTSARRTTQAVSRGGVVNTLLMPSQTTGSTQRYVSALGPDSRFLREQFE